MGPAHVPLGEGDLNVVILGQVETAFVLQSVAYEDVIATALLHNPDRRELIAQVLIAEVFALLHLQDLVDVKGRIVVFDKLLTVRLRAVVILNRLIRRFIVFIIGCSRWLVASTSTKANTIGFIILLDFLGIEVDQFVHSFEEGLRDAPSRHSYESLSEFASLMEAEKRGFTHVLPA